MEWLKDRLVELLPLPYFHVIFTMPHILNDLVLCNKKILYEAFFSATSFALNKFSRDKKFLGAQTGFIGILHTWGQNLFYHVHIHYIVVGGGLDSKNHRFIRLPYQKKFIFPVKALSKTVRGKFVELLKTAYNKGQLQFPGELASLSMKPAFLQLCQKAGNAAWTNFAKKPFAGANRMLEYIGRYTHRVAISNHRIKDVRDSGVTFIYKDYRDQSRIKSMTLDPDHFIQRFLWHCLPKGFRKIRYYGFMGYAVRSEKIEEIRGLLHEFVQEINEVNHTIQVWLEQWAEFMERRCPQCKMGFMVSEPILLNSS